MSSIRGTFFWLILRALLNGMIGILIGSLYSSLQPAAFLPYYLKLVSWDKSGKKQKEMFLC
jgi:hypothetical protein